MRSRLSLVIFALFTGALAQVNTLNPLDSLSPCALNCTEIKILASDCQFSNLTCLCANAPLQAEIARCALTSCSILEALQLKNASTVLCNVPIRSRTYEFKVVVITLGTASGVVVFLRILSKYLAQQPLWYDDFAILFTLFAGIPATVLGSHSLPKNGVGKDIWTVPAHQITEFIRIFYIMEIMYFSHIATMKLPVLFFYWKIFPHSRIKYLIWATVLFVFVYGTTFIFLGIFQCSPISFFWTNWDGEHEGKCFNSNAMTWANAGIGIALDIWMLALPMQQVFKLNLHWKKKIGVAMMFSVGLFVTIVSCLRLKSLVKFTYSDNPTWDNFDVGLWSTIEINVGIFCACMPSLRLLVRIFPRISGSSGSQSKRKSNRYTGDGIRPKTPTRKVAVKGDLENTIISSSDYGMELERSTMTLSKLDDEPIDRLR
ncbi:hypothetical protein HYFRA_00004908 [Hymenoscyphus fraxineus]|uniref:Extracellular membrane protein CFEM domain-containing protein n=1 Tax=Hymenoscyphus fraxineus TaxID=746836 RepID=A0A9N9PN17_9HELO|nr:hypothetical protein HYFRA_00004908 [Hymenoscyphus fraxineus]